MKESNKKEMIRVSIWLRKAVPDDLKTTPTTLKFGQPYWLRSMRTGVFSNRPYILEPDTDLRELAQYLHHEMVYVPVSPFDIPEDV